VIHRVGAVSYALPPFLDLLGRVNRSPSRFKWNFVRLWKSMKPRVYENPHEGGTRDPRRDHVRIPKEIVLIPESARAEFLADPRAGPREEPQA